MMSPIKVLSATEFHVLLVLSVEDLYGYAILKSIAEESSGAVKPDIGSLYRVLGRLMSANLVEEVPGPSDSTGANRGRPRRYYGITEGGREALRQETRRLEQALEIARQRILASGQVPS